MSRLVVVERDAGRRDSLQFVLNRAGYEVASPHPEETLDQLPNADLLIIGDADLKLLSGLPRAKSKFGVSRFGIDRPWELCRYPGVPSGRCGGNDFTPAKPG